MKGIISGSNIKRIIREKLPSDFYDSLSSLYNAIYKKYYFLYVHWRYKNVIQTIRKKKIIKVAFFVIHESVWKYENLYMLFENDNRFEPTVVVCPYIVADEEIMFRDMENAYAKFSNTGFRVIRTFDPKTKNWIDIKKELKPDIIFFTNPYKNLTKNEYYITNFLDYLTCYVPYAYMITQRPLMQYNEMLHNLVAKFYLETEFHVAQAKKHSFISGINSLAVGYPGLDNLLFPKEDCKKENLWKIRDRGIKRIIWAPHHSIEENIENEKFNYSNFLECHQYILELAEKYKDKIQIAFKPHPILKAKLYKHSKWGKERTDKYYEEWELHDYGQLNEGEYINLFLNSDAMIFDSGSFLVEYLCVNKPSLYQVRNKVILEGFNQLGEKVLDCHYKAMNKDEIFHFIEKVVINGEDGLRGTREKFIQEFLMPDNRKSASYNIYSDICASIESN